MKRTLPLTLAVVLLWTAAARAQRGPAPLPSPEVKPDRTVIFRLSAPKAAAVQVRGEWGAPQAMTKDDNGVWTVTVGPLEPDQYSYTFNVDGATVVDPRNTRLKIGRGSMSNLVEVPGNAVQDLKAVPHGTLHTHHYESQALNGKSRRLTIYTPPGYETAGTQRYPVLYLLHGAGDDDRGWTDVGLAHRILDNLLAEKKAVPMLVVMPDGHAATSGGNNTQAFEAGLLKEIIPLVEKTYRVKPEATSRAIVGLSMGG